MENNDDIEICSKCGKRTAYNDLYRSHDKNEKWTRKLICKTCYKKDWIEKNEYKNKDYKLRWYLNNTDCDRFDNNEYCPDFIGVHIGENRFARDILDNIFEHVKKMESHNHPGFEYLCKNPSQEFIDKYPLLNMKRDIEYSIDVKTARLRNGKYSYQINHNNIPSHFMLIATNDEYDEDKIVCHHIWTFNNNDLVRIKIGAGYRDAKFYDRTGISIPNRIENLSYFKKWRIHT